MIKKLVIQEHKSGCLGACAAMLTNTSFKDVQSWCENKENEPFCSFEISQYLFTFDIKFILYRHFPNGVEFDYEIASKSKPEAIFLCDVESNSEEVKKVNGFHCILFDATNKLVYDPLLEKTHSNIKKYKIIGLHEIIFN